ncbi:glycosyltransferase [Panacibacter ginsenosidivorans]|uniref:Glycosyltransferase n=1 Tax=Panacibacter ginsenosidivorans TaxID=1813871 RepID=A0A5B8V9J1_9BACT|nr:TIGR04282 family arsenosugar biosynthesis glycosyltransferase [Panacibacter ginsenosidivorans]QEC68137.1 glycosyltransferase [Panacibacter ginsenosidivorans]
MKAALIILVHDPVPCTVKTGKVDFISEQESFAMRRQLLMHTRHITIDLDADKFLFVNESSDDDIWNRSIYLRRMQRGWGRGDIMMHAFETVFRMGYSKVVMICSDSIETETTHLIHAYDHLNNYDVVIGPAQEGGYYLIGMKKMQPLLFKYKAWNTPVLLQQTLDDIAQLRLTYHLQQVLNDVEEEKEKYLFKHRQ